MKLGKGGGERGGEFEVGERDAAGKGRGIGSWVDSCEFAISSVRVMMGGCESPCVRVATGLTDRLRNNTATIVATPLNSS